jgi:hypothetical protein
VPVRKLVRAHRTLNCWWENVDEPGAWHAHVLTSGPCPPLTSRQIAVPRAIKSSSRTPVYSLSKITKEIYRAVHE